VTVKRIRDRLGRRDGSERAARAMDPVSDPVVDRARLLRRTARRVAEGRTTPDELAAVRRIVRTYLETTDPGEVPDPVGRAVIDAFTGMWQPWSQPVPEPAEPVRDAIRDQFQRLYYHVSRRTWKDTWYRGIPTYKCPTDMWVYQELIDDLRPDLVVETGTFRGGSALFLADRLEVGGNGRVITIDVDVQPDRPAHHRLTYLTGSSTDPDVLDEVTAQAGSGSVVMVILDSDHSRDHVAAELRAYAPLVTVGSYLIVEDTNVNGHPVAPDHGPGPYEAVTDFLAEDRDFEVDERCERYFLTQNPSGYLKRVR
jgi:cephalosporin hydroxylase